ncbi:MAG: ABC transporter permease [Bacteroidales bacterium]|nr:ABC transporter permease [Bacteroidales bacterium]
MKFERFVARRLFFRESRGFTRPLVRIAVTGVALGLGVMIVTVAVVTGFQQQVREKVSGFASHIRIGLFQVSNSYEPEPLPVDKDIVELLYEMPQVVHVQPVAEKAGIIKTGDQIEGVIFKGVDSLYDWSAFREYLIEGRIAEPGDSLAGDRVIVSRSLSSRLKFQVGDPLRMFFIVPGEIQPRGRRFFISGIYETGLGEMDDKYVIGDIRHIRRINGWEDHEAGSLEVQIRDFSELDRTADAIYMLTGREMDVKTVRQLYPQIFEWLKLHDMNVVILITLMLLVSIITIISVLMIIILEKTSMIGILKALGAPSVSIRRIFLIHMAGITGLGLLWGNVTAVGLCLLQIYTGLFTLNQESYYVAVVPVNLDPVHILLINAGTFLISFAMLFISAQLINRLTPVRAIRFN